MGDREVRGCLFQLDPAFIGLYTSSCDVRGPFRSPNKSSTESGSNDPSSIRALAISYTVFLHVCTVRLMVGSYLYISRVPPVRTSANALGGESKPYNGYAFIQSHSTREPLQSTLSLDKSYLQYRGAAPVEWTTPAPRYPIDIPRPRWVRWLSVGVNMCRRRLIATSAG